MSAALSLTESDVFTVLRAFLLDVLPSDVPVIRGQDNRVPEPVGNFVSMIPGSRTRLATNVSSYAPALAYVQPFGTGGPCQWFGTGGLVVGVSLTGTRSILTPTRTTVQLDFHGDEASDNASLVANLFRDPYACDFFAGLRNDLQPLYCDDAQQTAFLNGEDQFEDRWTLDVVLQTSPVTSTVQQFADSLRIGLVDVDAAYPVGA